MDGGLNTYTYVEGNPIRSIDPSGLVVWEGSASFFDAGAVFGGVAVDAFFRSECKCGVKYAVYVGAFGVGLVVGPGIIKVGVSGSATKFEDDLDCPNPNIFNGTFVLASIEATVGRGISNSHMQLGGATSNSVSLPVGVSVGVLFVRGKSWVIRSIKKNCCE